MRTGFKYSILVFILIFISIFVRGPLIIVSVLSPIVLIGFCLYTTWRHQQRASTQKWDISIYDMGFEIDRDHSIYRVNELRERDHSRHRVNGLVGTYRDHEVRIDEVDVTAGGEGSAHLKTRYWVTFENPKMLLLYMKKRFTVPWNRGSLVSEKYFRDIHIDNPLTKGLVLRGNNENDIESILDADICNRIMKIKDTLFELEIGYGKYVVTEEYPPSGYEVEIVPNALRYLDSHELVDTKGNAVRFKLILDTLIDIVEKIEAKT